MHIVHSLKNCIVNISNVDQLLMYVSEDRFNSSNFENYFNYKSNINERKHYFIEGGHSILEENEEIIKDVFQRFLFEDYDTFLNLKI